MSKTVQPCSSNLPRGLSQLHAPVTKKTYNFFSKIWVFRFHATQFGNLFASGSSSCEVYLESFAASFLTSSRVELPVPKNIQTNFSNCLKGFFATWSGDLFAIHFSRENRVFCTMMVFFKTSFKNFSVFPHSL